METERKIIDDLQCAMAMCFTSPEAQKISGAEQSQLLVTAAAFLIKLANGDPVICLVSSALALDKDRTLALVLKHASQGAGVKNN